MADETSQFVRDLLKEAAERLTVFAVDRRRGGCSICWNRDVAGDLIPGHREHCIIAEMEKAARNPAPRRRRTA